MAKTVKEKENPNVTVVIITVLLLLLLGSAGVAGYMSYLTEKSPSVIHEDGLAPNSEDNL